MKQYIVDAFTKTVFRGNPAAVCVMKEWLPDDLMQKIAIENSLSETAFVVKESDSYHIRWFTPGKEVDLCGHATLASACVLSRFYDTEADEFVFSSLSGELRVKKQDDLYVICTGKQKRRPKYITLSKEFFGGKEIAVDAKVRMIYDSKQGDIINQYVTFTRVFDEQREKYGYTKKAVEKTISICKRRNVLKEYLQEREKEVLDIMMVLYDEDQVVEMFGRRKKREGEMEGLIKAYKDVGWTDSEIADKIVDEYGITIKEARSSIRNYNKSLQPA